MDKEFWTVDVSLRREGPKRTDARAYTPRYPKVHTLQNSHWQLGQLYAEYWPFISIEVAPIFFYLTNKKELTNILLELLSEKGLTFKLNLQIEQSLFLGFFLVKILFQW